jgi:hypothetical protein
MLLQGKPSDRALSPSTQDWSASWRELIKDQSVPRVVNGVHQDGTLVPLHATLTSIRGDMYMVLFETFQSAVLTLDAAGVIQSASDGTTTLLSTSKGKLCGRTLASLCADPHDDPVRRSIVAGNAPVHVELRGGQTCALQVVESRTTALCVLVLHEHAKEPSPASDQADVLLGPYTVLSKSQGQGLCQAVHRPTGVPVAIKRLANDSAPPSPLVGGDAERAQAHEVLMMQHLNHPSVVRLYDVVVSADGAMHLVMERIGGVSLHEYCAEHGVSEQQCCVCGRT